MTRFSQSVERKPLMVSVAAFLFSLPAARLSSLPSYCGPSLQFGLDWWASGIFILTFAIWLLAFVNLLRAGRRGYSRGRALLAAVALSLGSFPFLNLGVKLLRSP